ncbi:putative copper resistance protein D [Paraoerskovia marina]|uniref:Putative copper resistance protein D n=1 Tax=Paraoerskovia marina TaxID=545619 RepID=A0A1H1M2I2_9CELL|nr:cytochrome c oxidase assembly protein [Paraoerskovia marina]SDR80229.1 putative copper resistance protein D [Paraoerskovia marina]
MTPTATRSEPRGAAPTGPRTADPLITPGTPWWLVAAGPAAVVVAVAATLLAGIWTSAYDAVIVDPGTVTRYLLPVSVVLTELSASVAIGSLTLGAFVLRPGAPLRRGLNLAGAAAGVWAVLAVVQTVLRYAAVSGTQIGSDEFGPEFGLFLTDIALGRVYLTIIAVAALTSALALAVRTANGALVVGLVALVALAVQSSTGHAAGAANHEIAISAFFLHLVGAAIWIGGLAGLVAGRIRGSVGRSDFATAVDRYSSIALWCYTAVVVSGVVAALIRVQSLGDLATPYGQLLIVKVLLAVALGAIGYAHREVVVRKLRALAEVAPRRRRATGKGVAEGGAARPSREAERAVTRLFWRMASVELLIMGAVSGVAVALGSSAPPVPEDVVEDPSPAWLLTGHELPPEPTLGQWVFGFEPDLIWLFVVGAGLSVYLRWVWRLRRRGDSWPATRTVSWCLGMLVFLWSTNGGAAQYGHIMFSSHMIQHMTLAMIVPIFLVLAAPVTLLLRAVPGRDDGTKGPREWVLGLVNSRFGHFMANPLVAAVNFGGSMIVFYFTPLFGFAMENYIGHLLMVVHFTLAGYLFVNALIGIDPGPQRLAYPQRLLLLIATMAFHAFFGVTLMMSESLLAADWFGLMGRPWGLSAIEDQQRGGGIAWGIGEIPTLALAVAVAVSWHRSDEREAARRDRKVAREGDIEMDEYNAMLAQLKDRDDRMS